MTSPALLPGIEVSGPEERLRSNFIGGIKHLPVAFTPGRPADTVADRFRIMLARQAQAGETGGDRTACDTASPGVVRG